MSSQHGKRRVASLLGLGVALAGTTILGAPSSAQALRPDDHGVTCVTPHGHESAASSRGERQADHRSVSADEQQRIAKRTRALLREKQAAGGTATLVSAQIPVYVHVMRSSTGVGDVSDTRIAEQIDVLNATFGGAESSAAADTGFTFTLAGTYRYNNDQWHKDKQSTTYRSQTRKGGANALNMWLVDMSGLGIATFPWDYEEKPLIDGIRVDYTTLPGGSAAHYDLGETATHEAGHWLGLWHTFQGGCTSLNDEVSDTPAQGSSTSGCPEGRDSCSLPGLDPIHNYMDYSYDLCYNQFTGGQTARMSDMWVAYRS